MMIGVRASADARRVAVGGGGRRRRASFAKALACGVATAAGAGGAAAARAGERRGGGALRGRDLPRVALGAAKRSSVAAFASSSSPSGGDQGATTTTVLVVGGGAREHALAWGCAKSPQCARVYCAPGNAGIAGEPKTECVAGLDTGDHAAVLAFCRDKGVDLVVVGPEAELVAGLADAVRDAGLLCFGPSAAAARLEGSKTFMKDVCAKYGIPTAAHRSFTDPQEAKAYIAEQESLPIVIKADGLAAGKGVVVAATRREAEEAVDAMLVGRQFGEAGASVVVEDFLVGEEASFFVIVDANGNVAKLHSAQDHKQAYDGDRGPNTGGMGAYSPAPVVSAAVEAQVMSEVVAPLVRGLAAEGCPFQGVIFAGLMVSPEGRAKVLEFNVRFGDPECEVLMYRLQSDVLAMLLAACRGELDRDEAQLKWLEDPALVVIMAANGYPGSYEKGTPIRNLPTREEEEQGNFKVFHAGTKLSDGDDASEVLANGGRVLAVTASGKTVKEAQEKAYRGVDTIHWPDGFSRRDIGFKAVAREDGGK